MIYEAGVYRNFETGIALIYDPELQYLSDHIVLWYDDDDMGEDSLNWIGIPPEDFETDWAWQHKLLVR